MFDNTNRLAGGGQRFEEVECGQQLRPMSLTRKVPPLWLRGRLVDLEIGVADKEGGTGGKLWGLGDFWGRVATAGRTRWIDRPVVSSMSSRRESYVQTRKQRGQKGERGGQTQEWELQTTRGGEKGEGRDQIRSRAVTSRSWNRVTMASGLSALPCSPTPVTAKVRLNVTCAFV